jgi:Flp pilus assembly protein TadG
MGQKALHYLKAVGSQLAHLRDQTGQELAEFAMVLPMLLALTFGIADFCLVMFSYNTLANAAREGARYAVVHPADIAAGNYSGTQTAARRLTTGLSCHPSLPNPVVTATTDAVTVSLQCNVPLMTGIVSQALGGGGQITLRAQATMRLE